MEISPENDKVFGFEQERQHGENIVKVRSNTYNSGLLVVDGYSAGRSRFRLGFSLDDAEEVAYRILYAVTKLREENQ